MPVKIKAEARPTKSIILDTLTTDITLEDAILDLLDNSIDGIRRVEGKTPEWAEYSVTVSFDKSKFAIKDNCGGIQASVARDYAFRFGRPANLEPEEGLLGMYGVGMKRAIFKMGRKFRVASTTQNSHFEIYQDLESWKKNEDLWEFEFDKFVEPKVMADEKVGTLIEVTSLNDGVAQDFQKPEFLSNLIKKANKAYRNAVSEGLRVTINKHALQTAGFKLKCSDYLIPANIRSSVNGAAHKVNMQVFAGIADSKPKEAGWYIFCNGRLVLEADQTSKTVWGEVGEINIPQIHNQFALFRGFAFLDCDDQKRLPWTSTKSNVDISSPVYKKLKQEMLVATRPVITFLNELDKEKDSSSRPRHDAVRAAQLVTLNDLATSKVFEYKGGKSSESEMGRISYSMLKKKIAKAKERLEVANSREVGQKTFDYWYKHEIGKS
jgi:hypothetical protein